MHDESIPIIWLTDVPIDARYKPTIIAKTAIATWSIHGNIGKNTVDVIELTALKRFAKEKWDFWVEIIHTIDWSCILTCCLLSLKQLLFWYVYAIQEPPIIL